MDELNLTLVIPTADRVLDLRSMRMVLVLIQAFVALTALPGGWLLMRAPDGHLLQLPLAVLTHAPFTDFFWPGVLLFGVVGGGHAVGLMLTWRRAPLAATGALLLGLGTVVWIGVQVLMTDPLFWIQGLIGALGLAEAALGGWLLRQRVRGGAPDLRV